MLDSNLCILSDGSWLLLKRKFVDLMTIPIVWKLALGSMIALVLTLLIYPKLAQRFGWRFAKPTRWQRSLLRLTSALLIASLFLLSPIGLKLGSRGLVAFLPADAGEPVDAIVILGRGPGLQPSRIQAAADLWRQQRAPLIFASGYGDALSMVQDLKQQGIPEAAVDGENCSRTTNENAQLTAYVLKPKGVERILLVTDRPHMLRSLLTFQSFGFNVTPHVTDFPELSQRDKALLLLHEYGGIVSYGLRGRFFPRVAPDLDQTA